MNRSVLPAVALLVLIATSSCVGDRSVKVTFVNDASVQVVVFPHGRDYPSSQLTIKPSEEKTTDLLIGSGRPDTIVAHVEASGPDGSLLFCRSFTYGDLIELRQTVHVRPGVNEC